MPDFIELNNERIGLGEQKTVLLNIAKLPTHTPIDLPVHVYRSKIDGPVLLLTGGLHGDEINGVEIVRRFIDRGHVVPDIGTVIAMPIVNVYGFIQNSRGVPDGKDINRSFPGIKGGSLARLLAYTLMNEIIPNIDYGVDFHSGGASRSNYPQIRCAFKNSVNIKLAKAFSAPVTLNSALIDKSFRKSAHRKGKPILVYEVGESLRIDEEGIEIAVNGMQKLMYSLGMNHKKIDPTESKYYLKSKWIRAKQAGIFQPKFKLGDLIQERQVIGYITDPYGNNSSRVVVNVTGQVIGLNFNPIIHKGDAIAHIAYNQTNF